MSTDKNSAFVAEVSQITKLIFMHLWGEVRFPHSLISTSANPWSVPLNSSLKFPEPLSETSTLLCDLCKLR